MKHKWYNEIVAWAGGAEIECRRGTGVWYSVDCPDFNNVADIQFRIKPINIPQTSQQIVKEMTKKFEEELREKEKAFRDAIDEVKVKHQIIEKPQPKQKKYLYVYYRDNKVYFLQDKDASNRYYIGKIEVQDD